MGHLLEFTITTTTRKKVVAHAGKTYTVKEFADKIGVPPAIIHFYHRTRPKTYHIEISRYIWKKANNISPGRMVFLNDNGHFEAGGRGDLEGLSNKSRSYKLAQIPSPSEYELKELENYTYKGRGTVNFRMPVVTGIE